jgi:hypothetical protein
MTIGETLSMMIGDGLLVAEVVLGRAAALVVALIGIASTAVLFMGRGRRL